MRNRTKKMIAILLSLALFCSLGAGCLPAPNSSRKAVAAGKEFVNMNQNQIVEAMGAGWNLGNQMEASKEGVPTEDYWVNSKVTERLMRTVKRSGFQSVRIPVSWLSLIGPAPDYKLDTTWLNRVQTIIDWAVKYDLYVIMNIHGDGYTTVKGGWLFPTSEAEKQDAIKEKYEAVWKQLAEHFKDYDEHLIFESMNEVGAEVDNGKTTEKLAEDIRACYVNINAYNQIFVDTVRKSGGNNDKRWLLIPGWNTNVDYTVGDYGFKIPTDTYRSSEIPQEEQRIMISVHYYSPWIFCGQEDFNITQWGCEAENGKTVAYQQEDYMEDQFASLKETFVSKGYPVVIGEYGSIDKSLEDEKNTDFRAYYAWKLCTEAKKNGCIPVYWDNGWNGKFGFGIFNRTTYEVTQPKILDAILRAYTEQEGTGTSITLDKNRLSMELSDSPVSLQATVTPADSKDAITWESSDTSVASVSYQGRVTPKGVGTSVISAALPGGTAAYCVLEVTNPLEFKAGLYAGNSVDWGTIECDDYLTLKEDGGGTYTISMSGSKERMSQLNTLFIKDVTVQRGVAKETILKKADFVVDSLTFNDHPCTLTNNTFSFAKDSQTKVVDICMLNYWYKQANCISELIENENAKECYCFPKEWYVDGTNTLTMQVTLKNAVLEKAVEANKIPVTSLTLGQKEMTIIQGKEQSIVSEVTPADANEKVLYFSENSKIATVDKDGKVIGQKLGETVVHVLTVSGIDETCKVKVVKDDGSTSVTPSPIPGQDNPGTTSSPASGQNTPGIISSPAPGQNTPGITSSPAPGQNGISNGKKPSDKQPKKNITKKVTVKKVSIKKVKSPKKKTLLVSWKKLSGVNGYQIQVSTNKKFKKGVKKYKAGKAKNTKKTIRKLKRKKRYYVRVRAYKNVSGKKYYGKFSKVKKAKVK